jgi:hypothetical protein
MMLDMYPKERLQDCAYVPKQNPFDILNWFDRGNYFMSRRAKLQNLWLQGWGKIAVLFRQSASAFTHP